MPDEPPENHSLIKYKPAVFIVFEPESFQDELPEIDPPIAVHSKPLPNVVKSIFSVVV